MSSRYIYHTKLYGATYYGSWWDLYFSGANPLLIFLAKVVSIDGDRH